MLFLYSRTSIVSINIFVNEKNLKAYEKLKN